MSRSRSMSSSRSRSSSPPKTDRRKKFEVIRSPGTRTPRKNTDNPKRIWVGGLVRDVTEKELEKQFGKIGKVAEVKVRNTARDTFAFVEFEDSEDAKDAIAQYDQTDLCGSTCVKVNWAQYKSPNDRSGARQGDPDRRVRNKKPRFQCWVGRLSDRTREKDLEREFGKFGDVLNVNLRSTSKDIFAFIEFDNSISCEEAIKEMDQRDFLGSNIRVDWSNQSLGNNNNNSRRSRSRSRDRRRRYSISPRRRSRSRERGRRDRDHGRRKVVPKGKFKIKLENLPPEMTWMDLKNLGRSRGGRNITFARTWVEDGLSWGILEFDDRHNMEDLMNDLDGKKINDYKIHIREVDDRR